MFGTTCVRMCETYIVREFGYFLESIINCLNKGIQIVCDRLPDAGCISLYRLWDIIKISLALQEFKTMDTILYLYVVLYLMFWSIETLL